MSDHADSDDAPLNSPLSGLDHRLDSPLYDDPYAWFEAWYQEAIDTGMTDPNAISLATADARGRPSVRIVLLKEHSAQGFTFYTNFESQKGSELQANPYAALLLFWRDLHRQIRIAGPVHRAPEEQADAYFRSRARDSRLGAWASQQSRPLESRHALMARLGELEQRYLDEATIPRPPHWGGLTIAPLHYEFWQAGDYRLHDRFSFRRDSLQDDFTLVRLNP